MSRVVQSIRRSGSLPLCSVCDGRIEQEPILLCVDCVHKDRVRTFCAKCKERLDLSLQEARDLFKEVGYKITRTGTVVFFTEGCPSCCEDGGGNAMLLTGDFDESVHDRVA